MTDQERDTRYIGLMVKLARRHGVWAEGYARVKASQLERAGRTEEASLYRNLARDLPNYVKNWRQRVIRE